jgi:hypothetical protein
VPSFYSIVDSISTRVSRVLGRLVGPNEDALQSPHAPEQAMRKPELRLAAE